MSVSRFIRAALALSCLAATSAFAQDVLQAAPDHYKVRVDNADVRVIENVLKPGEKDAMHTHPAGWYYVTQPGKMKVVRADGSTEIWDAKAGEASCSSVKPFWPLVTQRSPLDRRAAKQL